MLALALFPLFLARLGSALPADQPSSSIEARDMGLGLNVFLCKGSNWAQPCNHVYVSTCVNIGEIPGDTPGQALGTVLSVGPDVGISCTIFSGPNCSGSTLIFGFPGHDDLDKRGWVGPNGVASLSCTAAKVRPP